MNQPDNCPPAVFASPNSTTLGSPSATVNEGASASGVTVTDELKSNVLTPSFNVITRLESPL